jgi:hypothetical protein
MLDTHLRFAALLAASALVFARGTRAQDATPTPPLVQALPVGQTTVSSQPAPLGDHWGVISATTDAPGHDVLSAEIGFPGISFGYTHGISDNTDWGVKLDLNYGVLYTTNTQFGMAARLPLRMIVARNDVLTLLVHIDPGLFLYAANSSAGSTALAGILVPFGAAVGFQPVKDLRVSVGVDLPMAIQVLHHADFFIGPQFGFTVETYVDQHLSVGLDLKFGPMFIPTSNSDVQLGFVAQAVMGYRL